MFSKRNRKHVFRVSIDFYRDTRESLGDLEKAVETLAFRLVFPQHFSFSQTSTRVSITLHVFYFLSIDHYYKKSESADTVLDL